MCFVNLHTKGGFCSHTNFRQKCHQKSFLDLHQVQQSANWLTRVGQILPGQKLTNWPATATPGQGPVPSRSRISVPQSPRDQGPPPWKPAPPRPPNPPARPADLTKSQQLADRSGERDLHQVQQSANWHTPRCGHRRPGWSPRHGSRPRSPPGARRCRASDGGVEHTNRAKVGLTLSDS
jgi:hypothetical protein